MRLHSTNLDAMPINSFWDAYAVPLDPFPGTLPPGRIGIPAITLRLGNFAMLQLEPALSLNGLNGVECHAPVYLWHRLASIGIREAWRSFEWHSHCYAQTMHRHCCMCTSKPYRCQSPNDLHWVNA